MKKLLISIIVTALLLSVTQSAVYAGSDRGGNINATGVELVKKATIKGSASKGVKPASYAATGTLGAQTTGNRYAIVIGINDYPGTASDLSYCVNDANEMADVLSYTYGFTMVNRKTNMEATKAAIQDMVVMLRNQAGPNDEVVFFFSGHGAKGKVADGDRNSVDQSIVVNNADGTWGYIWDGELVQWFTGFKTNRLVFIFDSCLSGGMSVLAAPGRVVNMACTATGLSYESSSWGGGHGQFTYYFAEQGMRNGLADVRTHDEKVTVEEAFDYAKANCRSQTPTIADRFTYDLLP